MVYYSWLPGLIVQSISVLTGADMGDVVNLKRFRKRLERQKAAQQAKANAARTGRGKAERMADKKGKERADRLLDQHRLDGEDGS